MKILITGSFGMLSQYFYKILNRHKTVISTAIYELLW